MSFSKEVLAETAFRARIIAEAWRREAPMTSGTQRWSADFDRWLTGARPSSEARASTTRALRKMRRVAPRMYEVSYRLFILGEGIDEVTRWLNERAVRNNIPLPAGRDAHYARSDTVALVVAACDFVWCSSEG